MPTKVDLASWEKWTSQNATSLIESKAATRVGLYQAFNDYPLATKTPDTVNDTKLHSVDVTHSNIEPPTDKRCLVMYQTEDPDVLTKEFLRNIRQASDTLSGKEPMSCAEWDSRVYKLIQDFHPKGAGYGELHQLTYLVCFNRLLIIFPPFLCGPKPLHHSFLASKWNQTMMTTTTNSTGTNIYICYQKCLGTVDLSAMSSCLQRT